MRWQTPPVIKIYEALGSVADGRIEVHGNMAKVYSSSGNKFYEVKYDPKTSSITANDNGSYWKGYLGYPMITFLLSKNFLPLDLTIAEWLKDFHWKDINQEFKNDFDNTEAFIRAKMVKRGADLEKFDEYKDKLMTAIKELDLSKLGPTAKPPSGY